MIRESEKLSPADNPEGPSYGAYRVLRGGSWYDGVDSLRCAFRDCGRPQDSDDLVGFRCAVTLRR